MITGNKRKSTISVDDVLHLTDGGKDIYLKYVGKLSKGAMKRPWGRDTHPSWGVWQAPDGIWMWKDHASEEVGGPMQFVQRMFNLGYPEAIQKVCFDLGLDAMEVRADRVYKIQEKTANSYIHITAKVMKFKERHHAFWNSVDVTEDWCKKFDCYAVKELSINRKKVAINEHERVFVYLASDINKVKVYFPDRDGNSRFRTNVPYQYLWGYNKITHLCDNLVIHKSMKDLITFAQIHPHNIATQNESTKIFTADVVDTINHVAEQVWVFYGSDTDGVGKCTEITGATGWKYINTPRNMLPEINDVYSYVKKHGLKKLEQYCKSKNLL